MKAYGNEVYAAAAGGEGEKIAKAIYTRMAFEIGMVMVKRCQDLDVFSESQARYLHAQISQKGYRKFEPLDDIIDFEKPYLLKQSIELLIENEVVSPEKLLDDIAFNKKLIDSLCYLPENMLRERRRKPKLTLIINDDLKQA